MKLFTNLKRITFTKVDKEFEHNFIGSSFSIPSSFPFNLGDLIGFVTPDFNHYVVRVIQCSSVDDAYKLLVETEIYEDKS